MSEAEVPIVRWDAEAGALVDDAGRPVTSAQSVKARRILELGLLGEPRLIVYERRARRVMEYALDPLPGCKQRHTLRHIEWMDGGRVRHEFTCSCQRARGTSRSAAGVCSHIIALSRSVFGRSTAA